MPHVRHPESGRVCLADEKSLKQLLTDGWEQCASPEKPEEGPARPARLHEPRPTQHKLYHENGKSILGDSKQLAHFLDLGWKLEPPKAEEAPAEDDPPAEDPPSEDEDDDLDGLESLED